MSVKPPPTGWFWLDNNSIDLIDKIGRLAFCVLAVITRFANRERVAEITTERIGKYLGVSARSVRFETAKLCRLGILSVEKSRGRGVPNRFTISPIAPPIIPEQDFHNSEKGGSTVPPIDHEKVEAQFHHNEKGGSTAHKKVEVQRTKGGSGVPPLNTRDQDLLVQDKKAAVAATIPASLDTGEFRSAWEDFKQHRVEKRSKMTPTAMTRALAKLEKMGIARAVAALEHSTENGYTGIFEPTKENQNGKSEKQISGSGRVRTRDWEAELSRVPGASSRSTLSSAGGRD